MKLEVGMYVRYKNGIGKIVAKYVKGILLDKGKGGYFRTENVDIIKASHNIGELLEAGDFLDFHCIEKIEDTTIYLTDGWFIDFEDVEDMVETICTKEQFESMSYKVGE